MRGDYWLFIAFLILVASLILQQIPLVIITLLFLLTGGVSRLWNRYCLRRVEYKRNLSQDKVFFGEEIVYEIEVANRKPLPLPWIQIEDQLPQNVTLLKGRTTVTHDDRIILSNMFPLNMYHRIKRRFPMRCSRRGLFIFGPTEIRSGDLFGFFRRYMTVDKLDYLIVYPRLVPLEDLGIPSQQLFGDIRLKRHLFQDPVLTAGVREYHYGDSLKRINWKSTARHGELHTKVYEPTTTIDISIFLDVRTLPTPLFGSVVQLQELGIITAASIARDALRAGFPVGLHINQITRFSKGLVRVPHSQHPDQLLHILDALAQLHQVETIPAGRFLQREARNLPWGSTLVAITAQATDELLAQLLDMRRLGRNVVLVKVGGEVPETVADNLTVYHITDDIAWDVIEKIGLKEA